MCTHTAEIDMGFCRGSFKAGTHMCFIFRDGEERRRIISKFLDSGIHNREKVSGEMSWAPGKIPGFDRLMECESGVNKVLE